MVDYKTRDGEPCTVEEALAEAIQFGAEMDKMAQENWAEIASLREQLAQAKRERDARRRWEWCGHCGARGFDDDELVYVCPRCGHDVHKECACPVIRVEAAEAQVRELVAALELIAASGLRWDAAVEQFGQERADYLWNHAASDIARAALEAHKKAAGG